jgi:hypothetical protein
MMAPAYFNETENSPKMLQQTMPAPQTLAKGARLATPAMEEFPAPQSQLEAIFKKRERRLKVSLEASIPSIAGKLRDGETPTPANEVPFTIEYNSEVSTCEDSNAFDSDEAHGSHKSARLIEGAFDSLEASPSEVLTLASEPGYSGPSYASEDTHNRPVANRFRIKNRAVEGQQTQALPGPAGSESAASGSKIASAASRPAEVKLSIENTFFVFYTEVEVLRTRARSAPPRSTNCV